MTARKKLFVTGAHGFVAGHVLNQADDDWEVHAISRGAAPSLRSSAASGPQRRERHNLHWHVCDPLNPAQMAQLFRQVQPQAVIHSAALADIDVCQAHPESARAVNVGLTRTLADLCAEGGARLVFCSSDSVFDGEHA